MSVFQTPTTPLLSVVTCQLPKCKHMTELSRARGPGASGAMRIESDAHDAGVSMDLSEYDHETEMESQDPGFTW